MDITSLYSVSSDVVKEALATSSSKIASTKEES